MNNNIVWQHTYDDGSKLRIIRLTYQDGETRGYNVQTINNADGKWYNLKPGCMSSETAKNWIQYHLGLETPNE